MSILPSEKAVEFISAHLDRAASLCCVGFGLAMVLIHLDEFQKRRGSNFRFPARAVAANFYLPLVLSVPFLSGGILCWFLARKLKSQPNEVRQARESSILLPASRLITGEALLGALVPLSRSSRQGACPLPRAWHRQNEAYA